jgi:hypothetical protein
MDTQTRLRIAKAKAIAKLKLLMLLSINEQYPVIQEKEKMTFDIYQKQLKELYLWKNDQAIKQSYLLTLILSLFEKEIKQDNFSTGINRKISNIREGISRNVSKVKLTDISIYDYVNLKMKELVQLAISKKKKYQKSLLMNLLEQKYRQQVQKYRFRTCL